MSASLSSPTRATRASTSTAPPGSARRGIGGRFSSPTQPAPLPPFPPPPPGAPPPPARPRSPSPARARGTPRLGGLPGPEHTHQLLAAGLPRDSPPLRNTIALLGNAMRVVIAEDSILLREGVVRLLGESGFEVLA